MCNEIAMRSFCIYSALVAFVSLLDHVAAFSPLAPLADITNPLVVSPPTQQPPASSESFSEIQKRRDAELQRPGLHDVQAWNRLFQNIPERPDPVKISIPQSLPKDFPPGAFLRVGPNGAHATEGWMDGDGMVHCITLTTDTMNPSKSSCNYSCTYVETRGRQLEANSKTGKRFQGTLGSAPRGWPLLQSIFTNAWNFKTLEAQKDTCNTALAISGNRILALMEQCPPSEIAIDRQTGRVRTVANSENDRPLTIPWSPVTGGSLSAHGRTQGNQRFHVSYNSNAPPYVRVDVFEENWKLIKSIPVNTKLPTMLHDCAVTDNYVVIFDFPLTLRTSRFLEDRFPVEYEPEYGARIGLLHKQAEDDSNMVWFDVQPGVVLHFANAYEVKNKENASQKVVVQVLRSEPIASKAYIEEYASSFLHEYELDIRTGSVREICLNPNEVVEFPAIRDDLTGKPTESIYCINVASIGGPLETHRQPKTGINIDGITKFDGKGTVLGRYTVPDSRWFVVSEPTVVAKTNGSDGEYILLLITNIPPGKWRDIADEQIQTQLIILDGNELDQGPVWSCQLPYHVPYGLHSLYVPWEKL